MIRYSLETEEDIFVQQKITKYQISNYSVIKVHRYPRQQKRLMQHTCIITVLRDYMYIYTMEKLFRIRMKNNEIV